jgi:hypothetical protein
MVLGAKLDMEQGERRERLANSRLALNAEHLNQLRRKGEFEQEAHEKMSRQRSIIPMLDTFYGGAEGDVGQWVTKQLRRGGHIEDVNGEPTANGYGWQAALKNFSEDDNMQARMMQVGIDSARRNRDAIREELKNKPGDEKLTADLQRHQQALDTFIAGMKEVNSKFQSKEEIAAEQLVEQRKLEQTDRLRAETERHNRAMEAAAKLKSKSGGSGAPPADKAQQERKKSFTHYYDKAFQALSGAGTFFPLEEKQKREIASDALKKAETVAKQYKAAGGDLRDLGIDSVDDLRALQKLPEGLTWESVELNREKYGKTIPEIIEQYNKLYGKKK